MELIQKTGRFYTRIIMQNIGIFIFIGLLSVLFHTDGWLPNENMYAISQFAYWYALPCMIAFSGGNYIGGSSGGILSVLSVCGIITANPELGILGAMISGPFGGYLWKQLENLLNKTHHAQTQMLYHNLLLGTAGCLLAGIEYYILSGISAVFIHIFNECLQFLVTHHMTAFLSILIEPGKVFFLNNLINHGILLPAGLSQAEQYGSSILFLLETNPGPGLGVLLACLVCYRKKKAARSEYFTAITAEFIGGIHEVYFPVVFSDLRLLFPLILGGVTGSIWFDLMHCGTVTPVSPGSIITLLLLSEKGKVLYILCGVILSAAISFFVSLLLLRSKIRGIQEEPCVPSASAPEKETVEPDTLSEQKQESVESDTIPEQRIEPVESDTIPEQKIEKIGFVCDGGMGSSAMGAALFRRCLAKHGISGIEVKAHAADMIPDDLDLIVCQEDYYKIKQELHPKHCYVISSFTKQEEYETLAAHLEKTL